MSDLIPSLVSDDWLEEDDSGEAFGNGQTFAAGLKDLGTLELPEIFHDFLGETWDVAVARRRLSCADPKRGEIWFLFTAEGDGYEVLASLKCIPGRIFIQKARVVVAFGENPDQPPGIVTVIADGALEADHGGKTARLPLEIELSSESMILMLGASATGGGFDGTAKGWLESLAPGAGQTPSPLSEGAALRDLRIDLDFDARLYSVALDVSESWTIAEHFKLTDIFFSATVAAPAGASSSLEALAIGAEFLLDATHPADKATQSTAIRFAVSGSHEAGMGWTFDAMMTGATAAGLNGPAQRAANPHLQSLLQAMGCDIRLPDALGNIGIISALVEFSHQSDAFQLSVDFTCKIGKAENSLAHLKLARQADAQGVMRYDADIEIRQCDLTLSEIAAAIDPTVAADLPFDLEITSLMLDHDQGNWTIGCTGLVDKKPGGDKIPFTINFTKAASNSTFIASFDNRLLLPPQQGAAAAAPLPTLGLADLISLLHFPHAVAEVADWKLLDFDSLSVERIVVPGDGKTTQPDTELHLSARSGTATDDFSIEGVIGTHSLFHARFLPKKPGDALNLRTLFGGLTTIPVPSDEVFDFLRDKIDTLFSFSALDLSYSQWPQPMAVLAATSTASGAPVVKLAAIKGGDGHWHALAALQGGPEGLLALIGAGRVVRSILAMIDLRYLMISSVDALPPPDATSKPATTLTLQPVVKANGAYTTPFGTGTVPVRKGVTAGGSIDLSKGGKIGQVLAKKLGFTTLDGHVRISASAPEIEALIPGKFSLPTGKAFAFTVQNAALSLSEVSSEIAASVRGDCKLRLFSEYYTFTIALSVSETQFQASLINCTAPALPSLPPLPGLELAGTYSASIGVMDEPPGFTMGLDTGFHIGTDPDKYKGHLAFVLDMEGPDPNLVYFSANIDKLDLWSIFEAQYAIDKRLGQAAALTSGTPLSGPLVELKSHFDRLQHFTSFLALHDASIRWAESAVTLPDGTLAVPGTAFHGTLNIGSWTAYGAFQFTSTPFSLTAQLDLSPLKLGDILVITGDGKGVIDKGIQVVAPGGANLHLDSSKSPYLHANLHVSLFETLTLDVRADVTEDSFEFDLNADCGSLVGLSLQCKASTKGAFLFDANGEFKLHLDAKIGPIVPHLSATVIHLNAGLDAHISVHVDETSFKLVVGGSFEFEGATLVLPDLTITESFSKLSDLPAHILKHIEQHAGDLFKDAADAAVDLAAAGAEAVEHVAAEAAKATLQVGVEVAAAVEGAAKAASAALDKDADKLDAEAAATHNTAAKVGLEAAAAAEKIGADATKAAAAVAAEAEKVFKGAQVVIGKITAAVDHEVKKITHAIHKAIAAVGHEISKIADAAAHEAKKLVSNAKAAALLVASEAKKIVAGIAKEVSKVAEEVAAALKKAAEAVANAARSAAHAVSHFFKSLF